MTILAPEPDVFYGILEFRDDDVRYYVLPKTEAVDTYLFADDILLPNKALVEELALFSGKNAETIVGVLDLSVNGHDYSDKPAYITASVVMVHKAAALSWFSRKIPYEEQENWNWLFQPYTIDKVFGVPGSSVPYSIANANRIWDSLADPIGVHSYLEEVAEHQPHKGEHGHLEIWDHGEQKEVRELGEE